MNCKKLIENLILLGALFAVVICIPPHTVQAAGCDCSKDTAEPPFLSAGADPNLLLMIDNSASMHDLAYSDEGVDSVLCFDDTYDPARTRLDPITGDPEPLTDVYRVTTRTGLETPVPGYRIANCLGSYVHLHLGSNYHAADRWVSVCRQFRTLRKGKE